MLYPIFKLRLVLVFEVHPEALDQTEQEEMVDPLGLVHQGVNEQLLLISKLVIWIALSLVLWL